VRALLIVARSKSFLDEDILNAAKKLEVIGCFCIGTNQVKLDEAQKLGVRSLRSYLLIFTDARLQLTVF
jgi:phosphoglycerate dehydrogenase-like enzyme